MQELNDIMQRELIKYEINHIDQLSFVNKLNNIILFNQRNIKIPKYRNNVDFEKNYQYSKKFFSSLSREYSSYLDKRRNEGVFLFNNDIDSLAFSNLVNGKKVIHFPIAGTLEDSYTITHEIIHDMSISEQFSINRYLFCEVVSLLGEMLQQDYFHNNERPKDYLINEKSTQYALQTKSISCKFELELINLYLETGFLNINDLKNVVARYSMDEIEIVIQSLQDIFDNKELSIFYEQRYIIGYTLASYMHNRILKNNNVSEFIDINDSLNTYTLEQMFTYLDLDYMDKEDLDLTDKSYQKIEKSYIKQIKSN